MPNNYDPIRSSKSRSKSKSPPGPKPKPKPRTSPEIPKEKRTTLLSVPCPSEAKKIRRSRSSSAKRKYSNSPKRSPKDDDKRNTFQRGKSSPTNNNNAATTATMITPKSSPSNNRRMYKRAKSAPISPKRRISPKGGGGVGRHSPIPPSYSRVSNPPFSPRSPPPRPVHVPLPVLPTYRNREVPSSNYNHQSPSPKQPNRDQEYPSSPYNYQSPSPRQPNRSIRKSNDVPRRISFDHSPRNSSPPGGGQNKQQTKTKKCPLPRPGSETPKERWMKNNVDDDFCVFENDSKFQMCLRYFRILSPHPEENVLKKRIRHLIWYSLIVDFVVALVSILSYGKATTCCGEPIFSLPGLDLNKAITIMMYIYMIGLIVEIHPVVREGPIPWNLMNPVFGFFIGFVVFVDDSPVEAISVWILEVVTVVLEFITYLHYLTLFLELGERLEEVDERLALHPKRGYQRSSIQRERRERRDQHATARTKLRKHLIGVSINIILVVVTLLFIIFVAKSGGMCVKDNGSPSIFHPDQQDKCNLCQGKRIQICDLEVSGETQCYFPYF
jgi:hypothetical protein